jgi:FAD dependent oxidoreductase
MLRGLEPLQGHKPFVVPINPNNHASRCQCDSITPISAGSIKYRTFTKGGYLVSKPEKGFRRRNRQACGFHCDEKGRRWSLQRIFAAPDPSELPLAVCADGSVLKNPSTTKLAHCLGMVTCDAPDRIYDVAIVGAGPAGLATAVYAASEGLSVIVFDACAIDPGRAGRRTGIRPPSCQPGGCSRQSPAESARSTRT